MFNHMQDLHLHMQSVYITTKLFVLFVLNEMCTRIQLEFGVGAWGVVACSANKSEHKDIADIFATKN